MLTDGKYLYIIVMGIKSQDRVLKEESHEQIKNIKKTQKEKEEEEKRNKEEEEKKQKEEEEKKKKEEEEKKEGVKKKEDGKKEDNESKPEVSGMPPISKTGDMLFNNYQQNSDANIINPNPEIVTDTVLK